MTERERLIELLYNTGMVESRHRCNIVADELLANGVIVPPCKVRDEVYGVFEDDVLDDEIILIEVTETAIYLSTCSERYMWVNGYLYSEMLDQKLFLTKEEAEQALKARDEG